MTFKDTCSKFNRYYKILEDIIEIIFSKLSFKMMFKAKLDELQISIKSSKITDGILIVKSESEIISMICISEFDENDELFIETIITHELIHLLFTRFDSFGDFCESDQTFAVTNIERKNEEGSYGIGIEECLCDYIALDIVSKLNNMPKENLIKRFSDSRSKRFSLKNIEIINKIISMFEEEKLTEEDCYDSVLVKDKMAIRKNLLLYECCSGGDMSSLIMDYDNFMGKGAWMRLNKYFDSFYKDNSLSNELSKIEREIELFCIREGK